MVQTIIVLVLIALGAYVAWKSWTPEGWDWKQGVAALVALGAAAMAWASDWIGF
jgi:predicted negative regulator of RcsB-dependent stress response